MSSRSGYRWVALAVIPFDALVAIGFAEPVRLRAVPDPAAA
ncbi:MAG: hypothetical protein ACO3KD_02695 [Gaiellales bacterium]